MASFSKILSKTDVKKRLTVPIKFLKSLPSFDGGHAVNLKLEMREAKPGPFSAPSAGEGTRSQSLHGAGRHSSTPRNFKTGDKVSFIKCKNRATAKTSYRVRAEKEIKIFGAIIGHAPLNPISCIDSVAASK